MNNYLLDQSSNSRRRGILLFSGGFDSTLSAIVLASNNVELIGLTIDYPGRPKGEREAGKTLSEVLPFSQFLEVSIGGELPFIDSKYMSTCLEGWIPYRNVLFWSIAAHQAVLLNADFIAAGHDDEDDGKIFNDATNEFFVKLKEILRFSGNGNLNNSIDIVLPIAALTDKQLRSHFNNENINLLHKTWSCWRNGNTPCKQCYACNERDKFFSELNGIHK